MWAWIGGLLKGILKIVGIELGLTFLIRSLILSAILVVIPVMLYNVITRIMQETINVSSTYLGGIGAPTWTLEFVGLGAWLIIKFRVIECLTLMFSALTIRFSFGMLRIIH